MIKSNKESIKLQQADAEQELAKQQQEHLDLEIRKIQRRKFLLFHELEQKLLQEVIHMTMLKVDHTYIQCCYYIEYRGVENQ